MTQELKNMLPFLLSLISSFPLPGPYKQILDDQLSNSTYRIENYGSCIKLLFSYEKEAKTFPLWTPTMIQSCQFLKRKDPVSCHLFVEHGYIVQFEIVDMGLNIIDLESLKLSTPVFDYDYDLDRIKHCLAADDFVIESVHNIANFCSIRFCANTQCYTLELFGCLVQNKKNILLQVNDICGLQLEILEGDKYHLFSNDHQIDIECSVMYISYNHA